MVITADNKETLDMLQRDRASLEQALADAGLKADAGSLSFNLRGGQHDQANDQRFGRGLPQMPKILPEEEELIGLATMTKNYVVEWHEGLDIKI
jgi:hypothetical protein